MLLEILNPKSNVIASPSLSVILTLNEVKGKNLAQDKLRVAILVGIGDCFVAYAPRNDREGCAS